MQLYRLKLRPTSPWRTPWQADTLAGLLCWACARVDGQESLRRHIIDPALAGQPPFLLSDAFPDGFLPVPLALRLAPWPADKRKSIKRARWLTLDDFALARTGQAPSPEAMVPDGSLFLTEDRTHNTLARHTTTTGQRGALFGKQDTQLLAPCPAGGPGRLSIYFRANPQAADLLMDLLAELASTGFGADIATGRGQFELVGDPEPADGLDQPPPNANAVVCLSTFQPAEQDPVVGCWDPFTKFGKLGPDFGLTNDRVAKNPLVMFRPGACFAAAPRPFLGRAIPMSEILPEDVAVELRQRDIEVIHWAFGLTVPAALELPQESAHA